MEFSSALMDTTIYYLFDPNGTYTVSGSNAASPFFCGIPNAATSTCTGINIMQGTPPTDFTALTSFSVRASDRLMFFDALTSGVFVGSYNNSRWNLNTPLVAATATGTATWFWGLITPNGGTNSSVINQQFIGTVGLEGSGADLTISSTSIVSGSTYRISSLIVSLPSTYTV
jgi:hypothetical protein